MNIALAQIPIIKGNVSENIMTHLEYIAAAGQLSADVVIFPELSLTGYELPLLDALALDKDAQAIQQLSQAATLYNTVVIAGAPLKGHHAKPAIAAVICFPNGHIDYYEKQYLHAGEAHYCRAGKADYVLMVAGHRLAIAICADMMQPLHAQQATTLGARVYIASAMISESGYQLDSDRLAQIALQHNMVVCLANHISPTGGWNAAGHNAIWNNRGQRVACSAHKKPGLLCCQIDEKCEESQSNVFYEQENWPITD